MLFSKKTTPKPQPFTRIFATQWLIEYSGVLPHSARQGTAIEHSLFCTRIDPKRRGGLLAAGSQIFEKNPPTHEVWCLCRLGKDRGDTRLLFRRGLYLPAKMRGEWQDWAGLRLTQGLHLQLMGLSDFYFLIPCKSKKEYFWCAPDPELSDYWESEISSRLKKLIAMVHAKEI